MFNKIKDISKKIENLSEDKNFLNMLVFFLFLMCLLLFLTEGIEKKDIGTAGLTLISTLAGATAAFRLNEMKDKKNQFKNDHAQLNIALFIIVNQLNALQNILSRYEEYSSTNSKAFLMPAYNPPDYSNLFISFEKISFILFSSNPQILLKLTIQQDGFHHSIDAVRQRNKFYVEQVQPAFHNKELINKLASPEEIKESIGLSIFNGAIQIAENSHELITQIFNDTEILHDQILAIGRELFPGQKFVSGRLSKGQRK